PRVCAKIATCAVARTDCSPSRGEATDEAADYTDRGRLHVTDRGRTRERPSRQYDTVVPDNARSYANEHRDARVQGWRADRGLRRKDPRHTRFHTRAERVQQQLPRRIGV